MESQENQSKLIAEELQQLNKVPSKEAVEIAAKIMANRARRELDLMQEITQKPKDNSK
jgi:hypothetical protein